MGKQSSEASPTRLSRTYANYSNGHLCKHADKELARGQIIGGSYGALKFLVSLEDHANHPGGTELVPIRQAVMGCGAPSTTSSMRISVNSPRVVTCLMAGPLRALRNLGG